MTDLELLQLEAMARTATRADAFDLAAAVVRMVEVIREQRQLILLMGQATEDDVREDLIATQQQMIQELQRQLEEICKRGD